MDRENGKRYLSHLGSLLFIAVLLSGFVGAADEANKREGKFLFQVFGMVRFPNDQCAANGNRNGTCYTANECQAKNGTNGGTCASGMGICCVFTLSCGMESAENITYFESTDSAATQAGSCSARICGATENICSLMLHFDSFVIAGPSTSMDTMATATGGMPLGTNGNVPVSLKGQCLTDRFTVSGRRGSNDNTICGINSGEHMLIDAAPNCNRLIFQLGRTGRGTQITTRQWSIKVTQYSCDDQNLPPSGCTQYFHGSLIGTVRSFNYNGGDGHHLANQHQTVCIRREEGFSRICWTAKDEDVVLSGSSVAGIANPDIGCTHGAMLDNAMGYECLDIPGAAKAEDPKMVLPNSKFGGRGAGLVSSDLATTGTTICSTQVPFMIKFKSDNFETGEEAIYDEGSQRGFQVSYYQDNILGR